MMMAYDAARANVVLYGGSGGVSLAATWTWNGSSWTSHAPSPSPPIAALGFATYDSRRQRVVVFGGTNVLVHPWEWNGATWVEKTPATAPYPLNTALLEFDPVLGKTVAVDRQSTGNVYTTWTWDGTDWDIVDVATPVLVARGAAYHVARRELVARGSLGASFLDDGFVQRDAVFVLRYESTTQGESCRLGIDRDGDGKLACADSDCAGYCEPACAAHGMCTSSPPRCGDGACSSLESCYLCPADCGACPVLCGDLVCQSGETASACPGDCP
jgi:hypothetical protein